MNIPASLCFLNGEPGDLIATTDRGFCYGHGLFETIRLSNGQAPLLHYHLARLKQGAISLGIVLNETLLLQFYQQLLSVCPPEGVVKLIVTAGSGGRGYRRSAESEPNYLLQWFPLPDHPIEWKHEGISLKHCGHRLSISPKLAGIKHLNRLDQVLARAEWQGEYPEGLMLDSRGYVIEGVSSNLFYRRDDQWMTPKLDQCGVAGVMRQYLKQTLLPQLSIEVQESQLTLEELMKVDELFVCNSVIGIWPVISLENEANWPLGRETMQIQQQLQQSLPCYA